MLDAETLEVSVRAEHQSFGATSDNNPTISRISPSVVNFLMVGCQRCGSTWVDTALREHPQIYLPANKQTYFFDSTYARGLDWYLSHFENATSEHKAVGEIATGYCLTESIPRVAEHFPHVKLMMSVRNPTERAYSYFQSRSVKFGWKTMHEAVEDQPDILERGQYIDQIQGLLEHYDRERLLLLFYDDLKTNDRRYLKTILRHLEVNEHFESSKIGQLVQVTMYPKLRRNLRRVGMAPLIDLVSKSPLGDVLRARLKQSNVRRYAPMDEKTQRYLDDHYRSYNRQLAEFAGRDLAHWGT